MITSVFNYYLFDYDGTICNTFPTIHFAMSQTFEKSGVKVPDKNEILTVVSAGLALHDTIKLLHPEPSTLSIDDVEAIAKIYRQQYMDCEEQFTVLFDGAAAVFKQVKESGKHLIVLSNKGIAAVERSLKFHGLYEMTDMIIAEGVLPDLKLNAKPDPMIYETVISRQFNIKHPGEVLMTGDTHVDILFANNCGIPSCWAAYGYGKRDVCEALQPNFTIQEISEVLTVQGQ